MITNPKVKPTFFNTRKHRLHWNYADINNRLFTIILSNGQELNFIYRDLCKNNFNPLNYFRRKNEDLIIVYDECSRISKTEYDMLKNIGTPSIGNCVRIRQVCK
tara:strand:+ start:363 stop:674 length:312 start_codon:yes stop_codon:yes gene_type:complete